MPQRVQAAAPSSDGGRAPLLYNWDVFDDVTVVLCAHGSRAAGTAEAQEQLCDELSADLGVRVLPGFLEITAPDIPAAIDTAVAAGARRVLLLPYFLHAGNHTTRDIPAIIEAAAARHPDVEVSMTPLLGPDRRLLDICADRARTALRAPQPQGDAR
jgi:sirohydrochlorin ferrochelatase